MGERPGPSEKDMLGPNNPAEQAAAEKALEAMCEQESPADKAAVALGRQKLVMDHETHVSTFLFSDNAIARLGWGDRAKPGRDLPRLKEQAEKTFNPEQDVYDVPLMRALTPEFGVRLLTKAVKLAKLDSESMGKEMEQCAARINEGMYWGPRGHKDRNGAFESPLDQQSVELGVLIRAVGKGEYVKLVELLEMTRQDESKRMTPADVVVLNQQMAKERHGYGEIKRSRSSVMDKPESWDVLGLDRVLEERGVIWNQEQGQYELRK